MPIRVPKTGVREIRSYLFMLYAIESDLTTPKLNALRKGLEQSLQQSWMNEPISRQDALALIEEDNDDLAEAFSRADRIAPILANSPIIQGNPRIVKRLLNVVKMRSQIAQRRSMPLDEAIITKLVIFERCVGVEAIGDFYRLIDSDQASSVLKEMEENASEIPESAPESWSKDLTTKAFILDWVQLEPKLSETDLRPAIYLSRETMPIGAYIAGLSPTAQEALNVLVGINSFSSPAAQGCLISLHLEEMVPVMEGVINHLRQVHDWGGPPRGFHGACLLARHSPEASNALKVFLSGLSFEKRPAWMQLILRDEDWFKED